jgi:sec-independent protein translocase protein TatA
MDLGPAELILILIIVLLLFGVGRIGKIGSELGTGIRAFREGLKGEDEKKPEGDLAPAKATSESGPSTKSE